MGIPWTLQFIYGFKCTRQEIYGILQKHFNQTVDVPVWDEWHEWDPWLCDWAKTVGNGLYVSWDINGRHYYLHSQPMELFDYNNAHTDCEKILSWKTDGDLTELCDKKTFDEWYETLDEKIGEPMFHVMKRCP